MEPRRTVELLASVFASVTEVCTGLTDEQWHTPTDLSGWDVQDNLAHLIGTERLLHGLPATEHRGALGEHVRNPIGEFNEHEIDARRGRRGDEVLAEWVELSEARLARLRGAADEEFATAMMTPTGPGTLATFLELRVMDCWAHEQDIRRALGRRGNLDSPVAAHALGRMLLTLPIVVGKRAACAEGEAVRFVLTGDLPADVLIQVRDGRAGVVAPGTVAPAATVTIDSEAFLLAALGRRRPAPDAVVLDGDRELGERVLANLAMMI